MYCIRSLYIYRIQYRCVHTPSIYIFTSKIACYTICYFIIVIDISYPQLRLPLILFHPVAKNGNFFAGPLAHCTRLDLPRRGGVSTLRVVEGKMMGKSWGWEPLNNPYTPYIRWLFIGLQQRGLNSGPGPAPSLPVPAFSL